MVLHPAQKQIARSSKRFRVINAGRRFGKTVLASEEIKGFALAKEARIVYIAPTIQQARDIMWQMLKKELLPITVKSKEAPSLELEVMNKDGKISTILLRGWEAVETLRGQAFDFIVLDEVASMRNFWVGWNEVLSPTLIDRKGSAMFISTPKGFNHFYDLYNLTSKDENYESYHFTTYDNPSIPIEEIEREKQSKPENTFAQEYLADFRKQEGLVYKEFSRDRHVTDELPTKRNEYIAGIDFGFTNPTAVIHISVDGDENYFVEAEWYKTGRTEEQIAEYVHSCKFNSVYPDPESPSAIEVMNTKGIPVVEVTKNKDSIQNGINRVRQLLKTGKLKIHKSCVNLISEFETYAYPEKRPNSNEYENPIKEHDHALDALRYALSTNKADVITGEQRTRQYFESRRNLSGSAR
ncbi:terminase large subunit [Candidatus Woesebacteria bacterium]|nr:terminase large subunit [Candidatus Woesebacteria bacterium]